MSGSVTSDEDEISCRLAIVRRYERGRVGKERFCDDWEDPQFEIYHTQDRYGFIHDSRRHASKNESVEIRDIDTERKRNLKWVEMFRDASNYFQYNSKWRDKLVNRVFKGVPDACRGKAWYNFLEIESIRHRQPGIYQQMLTFSKQHVNSETCYIRQIDLDVNRTYRNHVMFRERYCVRQVCLFNVLLAYSVYNIELGYCQGMSQIAALLLMYIHDEEDVFWGLHQLMVHPRYSMHGFFIQGFPKLIRFQAIHDRILKRRMPDLSKHLKRNEIDSSIYTIKWFFQCFLDRIPFSLCLRTWDIYLLEGEFIMLAMSYNVMHLHKRTLVKLNMDQLIEVLQSRLAKNFGYTDNHVVDRLRETYTDLSSRGLIPPLGYVQPNKHIDELPRKPFGLHVPTSVILTNLGGHVDPTRGGGESSSRAVIRDSEVNLGQSLAHKMNNNISTRDSINSSLVSDDSLVMLDSTTTAPTSDNMTLVKEERNGRRHASSSSPSGIIETHID